MAKYTPKTREELRYLVQDESIYLGDIDTSNIVDMSDLFWWSDRRDFSGIDSWDTSKVLNMNSMFYCAESFNQPIDSWDTSKVVDMGSMFCSAKSFSQPLDSWDTSSVEFMTGMFEDAESFNQDLNLWNVSSVRDNQRMFWGSGMNKLPKWYKKRAMDKDVGEPFYNKVIKKRIVEAVANPRPKKPKIAPQDKPQSNITNDWGKFFEGSSQPVLTKKSLFRIIGATLFFVILAMVAINFDDMRRSIKRSNSKATTQTTQTTKQQQTQPAKSAKQPAQNILRCDNKDLLNHLIKTYKNELISGYKNNPESIVRLQEILQKKGITLTDIEDYFVNQVKINITKTQTASNDEANKQISCEAEMKITHTQFKPFYEIAGYRVHLKDDNTFEFEFLGLKN